MPAAGYVIGAALFIAAEFFYCRNSRRRWLRILRSSLDYHVFHFESVLGDRGANEKSREIARNMLWVIRHRFVALENYGEKNGGLIKSLRGERSALQITGETLAQIARYRWALDERVTKLINTLFSTLLRYYLLYSGIRLPAYKIMDLLLLLGRIKKPAGGSPRLYLDLHSDKNS